MIIEEGKFYFIKDEYFDIFKNQYLMVNKENGNKRPCYLCFKDKKDNNIIWFIPISHKISKYKNIYNQKHKKNKKVLNFVFGNVLGKEKVFLIQNIFPITKNYIENKYKNNNKDVAINVALKNKVIRYAEEVIKITEMTGTSIAFNDIMKMKAILLSNLEKKQDI